VRSFNNEDEDDDPEGRQEVTTKPYLNS